MRNILKRKKKTAAETDPKITNPENNGEAESSEAPESTYVPPTDQQIPYRAMHRAMGRLIKKSNVVHMILVVLVSLVALIYLLSLFRVGNGSFTISLSRADMFKFGVELCENKEFKVGAEMLQATAMQDATNISVNDLPIALDDVDGSHNGENYIAYTFYLRNNGKNAFDYHYDLNLVDATKNLDDALRVAIYYNGGERKIFAKRAVNGQAEPGTMPFVNEDTVDTGIILGLNIGQVDKYTVVIWIEGDDPECLDNLLGGEAKLAMKIRVDRLAE